MAARNHFPINVTPCEGQQLYQPLAVQTEAGRKQDKYGQENTGGFLQNLNWVNYGMVRCHDSVGPTFVPSWLYSLCGGRHCFSTNTEAAPRISHVSAVGAGYEV